eukprot:545323_1
MTAPSTTVFEVQVSNKLPNEHIFVKLQAELQYVNYGLASAKVNVNHNKSSHESSSQSHQTRDNLQRNILSTQQSGTNINSSLSKESDKTKELSSSLATNTIMEPGFVRIAPLQSISIPVIVAYESQVVYITVYIENANSDKLFISNGLQINRQHIDIIRNDQNGYIEIHPTTQIAIDKKQKFRVFLLKWGFPHYLCDAMQNAGWYDMNIWYKLTNEHLIEMGFKSGHRILLRQKYKSYLRKKQQINSDIDCTHLLRAWNLPNYIHENMINNGWEDIELWNEIQNEDFIEM